MPKKPKSERQALIKKCDALVSRIVRYGSADKNGNVECISCGKTLRAKEAHCCHRLPRRIMRYRFDRRNLAPGCAGCNTFNTQFHITEYTIKQVESLGKKVVDEMRRLSKQPYKMSIAELRELHDELKKERNELQNQLSGLEK